MNPKATFFFVALSAPLLEKNHDPSYALLIGFLIVATGTVGWILWALVFRWQPIRSFYGRYAVILDGILSLVLAGFGFSMLYSFGRMTVEKFFPDAEMEERLFSRKNNSGIDNDSIISHTSAPAVESRTRTHVSGKARKFSINTFYL